MNSCGVCLNVYFVARIDGTYRPEHAASANLQFLNYLNGATGPLHHQAMSAYMRSPWGLRVPMGSTGIINPVGLIGINSGLSGNVITMIRSSNPSFTLVALEEWLRISVQVDDES
jgi:hypothetical protein